MTVELGYELAEKPTLTNIWTMWRFDLLFGSIALLLAAGYLAAVWRTHRAGTPWPATRLIWWLTGCVALLVTMCSGIGMNMPASFSMHMVGHLILSMVVPLFLILGAPLTLLTTAFAPGAPGRPGMHEWVHALTRSTLTRIITHPAINTIQFLFFSYVMYLIIPIYELAISEHAGHVIMNTLLLVSGSIYFWGLMEPDPVPHRRPAPVRLAWLLASLPVHVGFGVYLSQLTTVMGEEFYRSLLLPWDVDLLADQHAAVTAWAIGGIPLLLAIILLIRQWRDIRRRPHDQAPLAVPAE